MGYSQFGEEEIALDFFAKRGEAKRRFLDIGAHDGVSCSNTRRMAELGWGGTLVEPSPLAFAKLLQVYVSRTDINLANVGLVPAFTTRPLKFYESGGLFVGTFDDKHRDEWEGKQHVHYRPIYVGVMTIEGLCGALPGPYHFVSLDVEGINVELFRTIALRALGVELICVEHQGRQEEILATAASQGYGEHAQTEANILLAVS